MASNIAGLLGLAAVGLLLASPIMDGAAVATSSIVLPPYKNVFFNDHNSGLTLSGCSSSGYPRSGYFWARTGQSGVAVNASSPVCTNRVGPSSASEAFVPNVLTGGVRFNVPSTGYHNVSLNVTIAWKGTWNTTLPNCTYSGTSVYYRCEVLAAAGSYGYSFLNHSNTHRNGRIPHLTGGGHWKGFVNESYWEYICKNGNVSSCKVTRTPGATGGSVHGVSTFRWNYTGWFNASHQYLIGYWILTEMQTDSWHTTGGPMVGGTGYSRVDLRVTVNSVSVL